jgi:alkaline phosphatase D
MLDLTNIPEIVRAEGGVSRRMFLSYSAALAALPMLSRCASAADRKLTFKENPFSLGVASGDPDSQGFVLWTKLAPDPMQPDGGMSSEAVNVSWEIAEDEAMKKVIARGSEIAAPKLGHTVHVEAGGLKPDRWYWYRFRAGDAESPIGRTRTMPAADALPDQLKFAFASCQHFETGYYTAYEQMAKDDLDLVFHLGDYIYEGPGRDKAVRKHNGPKKSKIDSLADFRQRHMLYRSDKNLHGMHAMCPWLVTWDDHEFENNYANDIQEEKANRQPMSSAEFLVKRAAAYQAYYEMMPLRKRSLPQGPNMLLYRDAAFGRLAEFFVLDTRQFRTNQPNGDGHKPLNEAALTPGNSLLGRQQREWLNAGLAASEGTWNVLAQQVMMGMVHRHNDKEDIDTYSMDQWPGAAHERMDLVKFMAENKVANPVVITGDIHSNWVNNLRVDDRDPSTPVVATEFVGTSLSSSGNGSQATKEAAEMKSANPCVQFHNRERGYVRCTVTPKTMAADYVVVEDVTKPNGQTLTRASFAVEAGEAGAKPA